MKKKIIEKSEIEFSVSDDVERRQWKKYVINGTGN